jgi:PKD repeat protein
MSDSKWNFTRPLLNYTFQSIASNHSIHTYGNPVKDQVHVMFNITPTSGMHPLDVTFSDMSLGNPTSWFWQFGDGGTSIEKEPSHTYRNPGSYTVSLQAFNNQTSGFNSCTGCIEVN